MSMTLRKTQSRCKNLLIAAFASFSLSLFAADEAIETYGPANLQNQKASSLSIKGPLQFDHLKVSGKAEVFGPVSGRYGNFNSLDVAGPVDITDTTVKELKVFGCLNASGCEIENIDITTDESHIKDSKIGSIVVKKNKKSLFNKKNQTLYLENTTVSQGVEFKSGQGKIFLKNSSIGGEIKGATTIQQ